MEILINSCRHKISNNSYQISINKIEKTIDQSFSFVDNQKTNELNFYQLGEALHILNLFRESFNTSNYQINNQSNLISSFSLSHNSADKKKAPKLYSNYRDIQQELKLSKKSEIRKQSEILFIEQLWMNLNPENQATIRIDTVKEFLKILFSPLSSSIKEMADILQKFLQACFFLTSSNKDNNDKVIISPITDKSVHESELWSMEKLVREFLKLKENLLAYQGIKNLKPQTYNQFEAKNKDFTFKPKIVPYKSTNRIKMPFEERMKKFQENKKENVSKREKESQEEVRK
jgi:hypothetical protein